MTSTVYLTEQLLPSEDLSDKKKILKRHTDAIDECDEAFVNLAKDIIVDDQDGKIIESFDEATQKMKKDNKGLLSEIDKRIDNMVTNLNEQVEEIKEQRMAVTYVDPLAARRNSSA